LVTSCLVNMLLPLAISVPACKLNACMYRKIVTQQHTSQGQLAAAIHLQSQLAAIAQPASVYQYCINLSERTVQLLLYVPAVKHEQAAAIVTDTTAAANKHSCLGCNINTCATQ
jgi:hypothetical protein